MKKLIIIPFSLKGLDQLNKKLEVLSKNKSAMETEFIEKSLIYLKERAIHYVNNSVGGSEWYQITGTLANSFEIDTSLKRMFNSCWYSALTKTSAL